jgi:carbon monoxide dehydrogenase subunit G
MNLEYSGTIPVSIEDAWAVLSDLPRVASCLPGVRLDQTTGDEVAGTVTVPLGPLRLTYRGEAAFVERDPAARRVVIDAAGRDSHGEQAASARVTVQLRKQGRSTHVAAVADVSVRGMSPPVGFAVREFGTGLLREFVSRLAGPRTAGQRAGGQRTGDRTGRQRSGRHAAAESDAGPAAQAAGVPPTAEPSSDAASARASSARATRAAQRVPQPRPQPSPRLRVARGPEDAVYPVPPPGEGSQVPALVGQYAPYAGALAIGVLLGWLVGRRGRPLTMPQRAVTRRAAAST